MHGKNCLSTPKLDGELSFPRTEEDEHSDEVPTLCALELWQHGSAWSDWLVCDRGGTSFGEDHFGQVYIVDGGWVDWEPTRREPVANSWIHWLVQRMKGDDFSYQKNPSKQRSVC